MKFPNALKGLKKIYTSEMLILLAGILIGVGSAFGGKASQEMAGDGITAETALAVVIPLFAGGLIEIIARLVEFFGLKSAQLDDENFKQAYFYEIIGIAAAIVFGILSMTKIGGSMVRDLYSSISSLISIFITFYVIYGIKSLAGKLHDTEMVERGKKVFYIYAGAVLCGTVLELINKLFQDSLSKTIAGVLAVVASILMVVGYIMYLGYLKKAKKMLG